MDDLADGQLCRLPGAAHVAVYRIGDHFYATQDSCSHEQWSLADDGELEGYEIVCSLHLARFDVRDGRALCLPALQPLRTYPTRVVDGRVLIDVDDADEPTTDQVSADSSPPG
ncbi:non-heme iron oxygenase ferredoxin subunit [Mycobacterium saskatchewanense]|uniref:non-heme iron oxygenase ferredoxin subunit n=1 Tax=Mycobacterium saskatchewanense TaxID=220927 RepID=UPI001E3D7C26|nr:non-heme iron oxygenase ferredoxin subunit [Mycobacterium saskatchewanense]